MDDELLILRDAVRKIREMDRPLITIDGPCASGKTTLASRLAEMLDASVIHTDDDALIIELQVKVVGQLYVVAIALLVNLCNHASREM